MVFLQVTDPRNASKQDAPKPPNIVLLVRRPEEISVRPEYDGRPVDLDAIFGKAAKERYFPRRDGDTLYLFSPSTLPIAL